MENNLALTPRLQAVVSFYFANPSLTQKEIAKALGLSEARISVILNHEKVLAAYPVLAKKRRKALLPKMLRRHETLALQNENLVVAERATTRYLESEKVFEPQERKVIHEIQLKTVQELQQIVNDAVSIPSPVIDGELIAEESKDEHD